MIKTYIKLAFRSLVKNKVFSFINVFGLAIGLTCCMLISMYIFQELSYDSQHVLGSRLYQLGTVSIQEGKEERYATTPAPMGPTMQQVYPEIESCARLMKAFEDDKTLLQYRDNSATRSFYETEGYLADSTFFRLFTYKFREGDPHRALSEPNAVVISTEIADKLFGKEPALNKTLHINSTTNGAFDFKITGVFAPSTTPSHIDARFVMSMQSGEVGPWIRRLTDMANNNLFYTYLLLKPGTDPKKLEAKFPEFIKKYAAEDLKATGRDRRQFLTPVKDIHLYANTDGNVTAGGNVNYLYILVSIAIVTLLIACVNFMNLATARSSKRAIEIGVRKVLGAEKTSLVRQFLWEAILLSLMSFIISIGFTLLLRPLFERVSGKALSFTGEQYLYLSLAFLLVTFIAGLVAGVYPAFYLSAFKPVKVLKGRFSNSLAAVSFRKVLVVFQFVISVALIVASLTIANQMSYLRTKDLGFVKDQQVVIPLRTSTAKNVYTSYKNELLANSNVSSAGASIYYPGIANVTDWLLYKQGTPSEHTKTVFINRVDNSYLQTLGIQPVAGRLFSKDFPGDTANRIVLNEEAIRQFEFASAEDAIGKNIAANWGGEEVLFQIVGVVKDFHFKDLHASIESYGFLLNRYQNYNYLIAHVKGNNMQAALKEMTAAWTKLNPDEPFEYGFLDQNFEKNYAAEERLASIIQSFTIIAIFISCLGLFGLTTFSVEQRIREIGIRKVLGASTAGIVSLLSKDFLKLVVISFLVASPLAWYFVNSWLESFAYRAPFSIWIVITGWVMALLIAFLTISIQAVKVALSNPVNNLRTE
ncbi:MAG TPA: ABC transporter permease [Chitinophagaceae bacterium]|nr:ABC transporter permease [Chitinophagaceae bacterium]